MSPLAATDASLGPLLGAVLGASLLGGVHCVGMCGGLVAAGCGARGGADGAAAGAGPHLAYHGARGAAYTALGALAGGLGGALDLAAATVGVSRVAALLAGAALVLAGIGALLEARGVRLPHLPRGGSGLVGIRPPTLLSRAFAAALARPAAQRAALLGLATGLLPCGWLWAFLATAAGTGGALGGAAVMATFWAGTVPLLLAGGLGVSALAGRLGRHAPTLTALALVLAGLVTIGGRIGMPMGTRAVPSRHSVPSSLAVPSGHTTQASPSVPTSAAAACCGGEGAP